MPINTTRMVLKKWDLIICSNRVMQKPLISCSSASEASVVSRNLITTVRRDYRPEPMPNMLRIVCDSRACETKFSRSRKKTFDNPKYCISIRVQLNFKPHTKIMNFTINLKEGVPIYRQIANQTRYTVASGLLQPDEEISAVQPLVLKLNVLHSIHEV